MQQSISQNYKACFSDHFQALVGCGGQNTIIISPHCLYLALGTQKLHILSQVIPWKKKKCPFSELAIKTLWLLHRMSTKASVTVLNHNQNNSIIFKSKNTCSRQGKKTGIANYIELPLSSKVHQKRNGLFSSDF